MTGKVSDVTRTAGSQKLDLHFDYDAMGQRIAKTVTNKNVTTGDKFVTTYYVRDPQGNVLAVYEHQRGETGDGTLVEQHLYGASRLGMTKPNLVLSSSSSTPAEAPAVHYELTNHLGNVLAVITPDASDATQPAIESLTDYYPFGMEEPGRSYSAEGYRYGFNTQEKVQELGAGHTTALYWEYDGRLGRRWNMDPKSSFDVSPYATLANNPIMVIDILGDKCTESMKKYMNSTLSEMNKMIAKHQSNIDKCNNDISNLDPNKRPRTIAKKIEEIEDEQKVIENLNTKLAEIQSEFKKLEESDQLYNVVEDQSCYKTWWDYAGTMHRDENSRIIFNATNGQVDLYIAPDMLFSFAHEAKHAYQFEIGLVSTNVSKGNMYDIPGSSSFLFSKDDEREAYARGAIFGQPYGDLTKAPYSKLPNHRDINRINNRIAQYTNYYNRFKEDKDRIPEGMTLEMLIDKGLQNMADNYMAAFRYKGKTYYYKLENGSK